MIKRSFRFGCVNVKYTHLLNVPNLHDKTLVASNDYLRKDMLIQLPLG